MAFKKTLVQRLFNLSRFSTPSVSRNPTGKCSLSQSDPIRPEPGESGRIKRSIQRRPFYQSAAKSSTPAGIRLGGEDLVEKLRGMNVSKDRIRLDGLMPYLSQKDNSQAPKTEPATAEGGLTVREVRKVLRASQAEMIREKLREMCRDWISYSEFVKICGESCGGNMEQGLLFAKSLDESGSVIVLGNVVCLHPHKEIKPLVTNAIQDLVTCSTLPNSNDPRRKELEKMIEQKAEIDQKADALVRRELWTGLGYLVVQTAAFMRLTFWELSWDVMEPICFYVTSAFFMAGYAFFLRTSKEPSFEGFFQSRFSAKQKKLMQAYNFNLERYNELNKVFHPQHISSSISPSPDDNIKMMKFGDLNRAGD